MVDLYGWYYGCVEGDVLGYILKKECSSVNMMEFYLVGNWLCARNKPWRFPGIFLR